MSSRKLLDAAVGRVAGFRERIRAVRVTSAVSAAEIRAHLEEHFGDFNEPAEEEALVEEVSSMLSNWQVHVTHPRYFGLFNPPTRPVSIAADLLVAGFNPQLAAWSHAPAANEIERFTLRYLAKRLGFDPDGIAATFTTAGAEANQSAVLVSLNRAYPAYAASGLRDADPRPVIYVSSESHHSIEKAAMTSGLGRRAIRTVATDRALRMSAPALRDAIAADRSRGLRPLMVVGTAGTTGGGTIDPLAELADVCRDEAVWFHVDAAWGGAACLSPRLAPAIAGIERSDSVTWDAHKWLCVPMGAGMFFCRHPRSVRRAFALSTPYMPAALEDTADPYSWTIQWSRRNIGLKVFMTLAALGSAGYREAIERQAEIGDLLRRELESRGWGLANDTPLPVVCFTRSEIEEGRVSAAEIAAELEGEFWISPVRLGSKEPVLRACVTSYETTPEDVAALAEAATRAVEAGVERRANRALRAGGSGVSRAELPDFAIEVAMSRWEFQARHNLTASDAEALSIEELLALGSDSERRAFLDLDLGYIPTWGTDELRAAIAATYESCEPEDILTFAGAEEALFWIMQRLVEPGEHAIVSVPNYQSFESVAIAAGIEVTGLPLWEGAGRDLRWTLDLDRLRSLVRPDTRLLAVNFPNNPTGFVPDHATWRDLFELCEASGIRVVSDEVHRGLELDPSKTIPQAADLAPDAVSVNVMSKAYGLPGLRVGWVSCRDRAVLARLERAKHYTSICNSGPSESLAGIALTHADAILARNHALVEANHRLFERFTGDLAHLFDYRGPDGSCVAFPRYLGKDGVEAFCREAVERAGVLLLPGSVFASALGDVPDDRFRVGLGRRDFPEGLAALRRHLG